MSDTRVGRLEQLGLECLGLLGQVSPTPCSSHVVSWLLHGSMTLYKVAQGSTGDKWVGR